MNIITLITKRSLRESIRELRYKKFYSRETFTAGDCIEIIDANKKSRAIIIQVEDASVYKQPIRDGSVEIKKIPLSKTGPHQGGAIVDTVAIEVVKKCLADYRIVTDPATPQIIKDIFPKEKQKRSSPKKSPISMDNLSIDRYLEQKPTHTTELQLFVDDARTYFGEQARYGQGSFSYYLGICKKIPTRDLWLLYGEAKQARGKTRFEQKKLFWWKVGQYLKK